MTSWFGWVIWQADWFSACSSVWQRVISSLVGWALDSSLISFLASLSDWMSLYLLVYTNVFVWEASSHHLPCKLPRCKHLNSVTKMSGIFISSFHPRVSVVHSPEIHWNTLTLNATLHFSTFSCPSCLLLSLRINSPFAILIPQEDKLKNKSRWSLQATNLSDNDSVFFTWERTSRTKAQYQPI